MPRFSTGLRNAMAVNYGLGAMMNSGIIRVYGGLRPETPDEAPGSLELGRITTGGKVFFPVSDPNNAGLLLSFVSPGALINLGSWRLKGLAAGTAVWWRWNWHNADTNGYSTTLPRVDGLVGTDLVLANAEILSSTDVAIEQFMFVLGVGS